VRARGVCRRLLDGEVELVERGGQAVRGESEVEGGGHLRRGAPTRTGVGHGEGERDAVRGVEEVARGVRSAEPLVEVEGEGRVARDERGLVPGSDLGGG